MMSATTASSELTRAREIQRQREGYLAWEMINAQRFDFGVPDDFVASDAKFRKGVTWLVAVVAAATTSAACSGYNTAESVMP